MNVDYPLHDELSAGVEGFFDGFKLRYGDSKVRIVYELGRSDINRG